MSAQTDPQRPTSAFAEPKYYYRRPLSARELLPALGAAVGAGLVVFYLTKVFLERTPLGRQTGGSQRPRLTLHRSSAQTNIGNSGRR